MLSEFFEARRVGRGIHLRISTSRSISRICIKPRCMSSSTLRCWALFGLSRGAGTRRASTPRSRCLVTPAMGSTCVHVQLRTSARRRTSGKSPSAADMRAVRPHRSAHHGSHGEPDPGVIEPALWDGDL